MEQNLINLSDEQIQKAALAGITLLQTPGAVNVPSPMAITGIVGALNSLLMAIANGQVMVVNVLVKEEGTDDKTPPNGDGEKKADLTPVKTGKQVEK